jgi:hypothetical protein
MLRRFLGDFLGTLRGVGSRLRPRSRGQGLCKSYANSFSKLSFCRGAILGLFLRDGLIIGLSKVSRSPRIPLAISVENHALEIARLESGSGLIMGDFVNGISGHERQGAGKTDTQRGPRNVNRKK